MVRKVSILVVAAALAVALSGWGAAGGDADRRVRLPAALPADVPLPESARLRSARDLGSKGLNLVFETEESVSAAKERLRFRLESGGWALVSEVVVGSAVFSSFRNRGRSLALGFSRTGGVTVIGVAYQHPGTEREGV